MKRFMSAMGKFGVIIAALLVAAMILLIYVLASGGLNHG